MTSSGTGRSDRSFEVVFISFSLNQSGRRKANAKLEFPIGTAEGIVVDGNAIIETQRAEIRDVDVDANAVVVAERAGVAGIEAGELPKSGREVDGCLRCRGR